MIFNYELHDIERYGGLFCWAALV